MLESLRLPNALTTYDIFTSSASIYICGRNPTRSEYLILECLKVSSMTTNVNFRGGDNLITRNEYNARVSEFISSNSFKHDCSADAIIGLFQFKQGPYLLVVQKSKPVGSILDQVVYAVEKTRMIPLFDPELPIFTVNKHDEARYIQLFNCFNLGRDCLFSHSYDLTSTLQSNCIKQNSWNKRRNVPPHCSNGDYLDEMGISSMFCWNSRHVQQFAVGVKIWNKLFVPLVVGFFASYKALIQGRVVTLCVLARRSRRYAGTRYRKRGINARGDAANDCEVEQILFDEGGSTQSITSFVQVRASLPLFWAQDSSAIKVKPPIYMHRTDCDRLATKRHFARMFERYGIPLMCLNLVKQTGKSSETSLGSTFTSTVHSLNEELPDSVKLTHRALDIREVHRKDKARVFPILNEYSREAIKQTDVFFVTSRWNTTSKNRDSNFDGEDAESKCPVCGSMCVKGECPSIFNVGRAHKKTRRGRCGDDENDLGMEPEDNAFDEDGQDEQEESESTQEGFDRNSGGRCSTSSSSSSSMLASSCVSVADSTGISQSESSSSSSSAFDLNGLLKNAGFTDENSSFSQRENQKKTSKDKQTDFEPRKREWTVHSLQTGVVRTNCVDCLDRTNVGQFANGLVALGVQFQKMGLSAGDEIESGSAFANVLNELFELLGDTMAIQYGGSIAHKKYAAKAHDAIKFVNQGRELLTSLTRHYNNAFTDLDRQTAVNLFLGHLRPREHPPPWLLDLDNVLHHLVLYPFETNSWWAASCNLYLNRIESLFPICAPAMKAKLKSLPWMKTVRKAIHKEKSFESDAASSSPFPYSDHANSGGFKNEWRTIIRSICPLSPTPQENIIKNHFTLLQNSGNPQKLQELLHTPLGTLSSSNEACSSEQSKINNLNSRSFDIHNVQSSSSSGLIDPMSLIPFLSPQDKAQNDFISAVFSSVLNGKKKQKKIRLIDSQTIDPRIDFVDKQQGAKTEHDSQVLVLEDRDFLDLHIDSVGLITHHPVQEMISSSLSSVHHAPQTVKRLSLSNLSTLIFHSITELWKVRCQNWSSNFSTNQSGVEGEESKFHPSNPYTFYLDQLHKHPALSSLSPPSVMDLQPEFEECAVIFPLIHAVRFQPQVRNYLTTQTRKCLRRELTARISLNVNSDANKIGLLIVQRPSTALCSHCGKVRCADQILKHVSSRLVIRDLRVQIQNALHNILKTLKKRNTAEAPFSILVPSNHRSKRLRPSAKTKPHHERVSHSQSTQSTHALMHPRNSNASSTGNRMIVNKSDRRGRRPSEVNSMARKSSSENKMRASTFDLNSASDSNALSQFPALQSEQGQNPRPVDFIPSLLSVPPKQSLFARDDSLPVPKKMKKLPIELISTDFFVSYSKGVNQTQDRLVSLHSIMKSSHYVNSTVAVSAFSARNTHFDPLKTVIVAQFPVDDFFRRSRKRFQREIAQGFYTDLPLIPLSKNLHILNNIHNEVFFNEKVKNSSTPSHLKNEHWQVAFDDPSRLLFPPIPSKEQFQSYIDYLLSSQSGSMTLTNEEEGIADIEAARSELSDALGFSEPAVFKRQAELKKVLNQVGLDVSNPNVSGDSSTWGGTQFSFKERGKIGRPPTSDELLKDLTHELERIVNKKYPGVTWNALQNADLNVLSDQFQTSQFSSSSIQTMIHIQRSPLLRFGHYLCKNSSFENRNLGMVNLLAATNNMSAESRRNLMKLRKSFGQENFKMDLEKLTRDLPLTAAAMCLESHASSARHKESLNILLSHPYIPGGSYFSTRNSNPDAMINAAHGGNYYEKASVKTAQPLPTDFNFPSPQPFYENVSLSAPNKMIDLSTAAAEMRQNSNSILLSHPQTLDYLYVDDLQREKIALGLEIPEDGRSLKEKSIDEQSMISNPLISLDSSPKMSRQMSKSTSNVLPCHNLLVHPNDDLQNGKSFGLISEGIFEDDDHKAYMTHAMEHLIEGHSSSSGHIVDSFPSFPLPTTRSFFVNDKGVVQQEKGLQENRKKEGETAFREQVEQAMNEEAILGDHNSFFFKSKRMDSEVDDLEGCLMNETEFHLSKNLHHDLSKQSLSELKRPSLLSLQRASSDRLFVKQASQSRENNLPLDQGDHLEDEDDDEDDDDFS